jgi:hypothetical protein
MNEFLGSFAGEWKLCTLCYRFYDIPAHIRTYAHTVARKDSYLDMNIAAVRLQLFISMTKMIGKLNLSSNTAASRPMSQFLLSALSIEISAARQMRTSWPANSLPIIRTKPSRHLFENWEMGSRQGTERVSPIGSPTRHCWALPITMGMHTGRVNARARTSKWHRREHIMVMTALVT